MSLQTLNENLDIIQSLVIPFMEDDLDNIQKLDDEPNDVGGLTAAELKAEFDKSGNTIKKYINETLVPELSDTVAEAEVRREDEAQRQANEEARQENETARKEAENLRQNTFEEELSVAKGYTERAEKAAEESEGSATDSEAYAIGTRGGAAVGSSDPAYRNNAKYFADQAKETVGPTVTQEVFDQAIQQVNQTINGLSSTVSGHETSINNVQEDVSSLKTEVQPVARGGTGAITAADARQNLGAAPAYDYSQTDLTAGSSPLETGKLYFVYE